jgi:hypothetical protein
MIEEQPRPGGSWALQGCLFGAVGLFIVLLIVMLFLAFSRFREHTADPAPSSARDYRLIESVAPYAAARTHPRLTPCPLHA